MQISQVESGSSPHPVHVQRHSGPGGRGLTCGPQHQEPDGERWVEVHTCGERTGPFMRRDSNQLLIIITIVFIYIAQTKF